MANTPETRRSEPPAEAPAAPAPTEPEETLDWESRFKYLLADFDNFRRRTERDRAGARVEAEAALLRRLIPLVEGFQLAETASQSLPPSDPLRRGLELLGHELDAVLKSVGFTPVARVGEPFRADEHEAVGETPSSQNVEDGHVAEIVQQGYRFQGGLLRPAKVLVARAPKKEETVVTPEGETGGKSPSAPSVEEGQA